MSTLRFCTILILTGFVIDLVLFETFDISRNYSLTHLVHDATCQHESAKL